MRRAHPLGQPDCQVADADERFTRGVGIGSARRLKPWARSLKPAAACAPIIFLVLINRRLSAPMPATVGARMRRTTLPHTRLTVFSSKSSGEMVYYHYRMAEPMIVGHPTVDREVP